MIPYSFYLNTYRGSTVERKEWPLYEARAADQLAYYERVFQVTVPRPDADKMAVCAMAEALYQFDLLANGGDATIQSASIGSVSVQYGGNRNQIDLSAKGQAKELYRCASLYLDIYRGIGPCCT